MNCEFCGNEFSNKQNLNAHQKKAKYCLKIQGKTNSNKFKCDICNLVFTTSYNLKRHKKLCENDSIAKKISNRY